MLVKCKNCGTAKEYDNVVPGQTLTCECGAEIVVPERGQDDLESDYFCTPFLTLVFSALGIVIFGAGVLRLIMAKQNSLYFFIGFLAISTMLWASAAIIYYLAKINYNLEHKF